MGWDFPGYSQGNAENKKEIVKQCWNITFGAGYNIAFDSFALRCITIGRVSMITRATIKQQSFVESMHSSAEKWYVCEDATQI